MLLLLDSKSSLDIIFLQEFDLKTKNMIIQIIYKGFGIEELISGNWNSDFSPIKYAPSLK